MKRKRGHVSVFVMLCALVMLSACGSSVKQAVNNARQAVGTESNNGSSGGNSRGEAAASGQEGFSCRKEMYEISLEHGAFQIDDIIFDPLREMTLGEAVDVFVKAGRYDIRSNINSEAYYPDMTPYSPEELSLSNGTVYIARGGNILLRIHGTNPTDGMCPISDFIYTHVQIEENAFPFVWYGSGLHAGGENMNYDILKEEWLPYFQEVRESPSIYEDINFDHTYQTGFTYVDHQSCTVYTFNIDSHRTHSSYDKWSEETNELLVTDKDYVLYTQYNIYIKGNGDCAQIGLNLQPVRMEK
ncbi:MAG: hypothetical protein IK016_11245 [Lachnospiraceae bacterium]|nr:hypothetical protein [Lachnospiraceae bacterium]